jgi:hypothetical protein
LAIHQRIAAAGVLDQLGRGHPRGEQFVPGELRRAPDIGLVFRQRADAGNPQEGLQPFQEFGLVLLIVAHDASPLT